MLKKTNPIRAIKSVNVLLCVVMLTMLLSACTKATETHETITTPGQTSIGSLESIHGAAGTLGASYDPSKPRQARVDHMTDIQKLIRNSTYAYYRDSRTLPNSLSDLSDSGWYWFEPLPVEHLAGLQLTETRLNPVADDLYKAEIIFDPQNGYDFAFVMPSDEDLNTATLDIMRWEEGQLAYDFERYMSQFPVLSPYIDNDPVHIRQLLMERICWLLTSRYWHVHRGLPSTTNELLDGRFDPIIGVLAEFPTYLLDQSGAFYFGTNTENGIAYLQYMLGGDEPIIIQRVYLENDPMSDGQNVIGRYICNNEGISIEDTDMIVSSELLGWGFVKE